jgi:hypothetical protein
MVNYYETLKVSRKATSSEIKSAYRRLARKLHPDKNNGSEDTARAFALIAEAYEVLGDPKSRAKYDRRILQAEFSNGRNGDSVFASSNTHAKRWRQMIYEHRYNEIINRMIADERREAAALQKAIFPLVALFVSLLAVGITKPRFFAESAIFGKIIVLSLFIAGMIHLFGRIRDAFEKFTFSSDDIHDSILDETERQHRPFSRFSAAMLLLAGSLVSLGAGVVIGGQLKIASVLMPAMFSNSLQPECFFYPPIFVLLADIVHSLAYRIDV